MHRLLQIVTLVIVASCVVAIGSPALASGPGGVWEPLMFPDTPLRLQTPQSGAFFARTRDGLWRSDDGGLAWTPVPLPEPREGDTAELAIVADPTDHTVLYAEGREGLYQSVDDAASWSLVLPMTAPIDRIVVSPADPSIVYVAAKQVGSCGPIVLWRSDDRGVSWHADESRRIVGDTSCIASWRVLAAHATEPDRVIESWVGGGGRNYLNVAVRLSQDRGQTSQRLSLPSELALTPMEVLDGAPGNPARMYLLEWPYMSERGVLGRSDDAGQTWQVVYRSPDSAMPFRLAVDGANPNRVMVGHRIGAGATAPDLLESPIVGSDDGGETWSPIGAGIRGQLHDLALGIDGAWLFAATSEGLWRLPTSVR